MLDAVAGIKFGYVLCGIIWSIALGFAVGNYACSLVHRLPRGRLILDKKPYCGHCGHLLEVRDLFPVVSALLLKHRCRYCGVPYPVSHTWTEILVGLLFTLTFLEHGFTEQFLLIVSIGVFLITLAAIHANEDMIMGKVLLCVVVFGMLFRVLQDGSIYGFFQGGLAGLIMGAVVWRKEIQPSGHVYILPDAVQLLIVGGICVGIGKIPLYVFLFTLLYGIFWVIGVASRAHRPAPITVAFGFATILPILYPKLSVLLLGF